MNDIQPADVLEAVAAIAPRAGSLDGEWPPPRRARVRDAITASADATDPDAVEIPIRFRPARALASRRRWSRALPVAASVVALAAAAGAVVTVATSGGGSGRTTPAGGVGAAFDPPANLSDTALGASQYSYRVFEQIRLDANGRPVANAQDAMTDRNWVAANGDILSFRTGSQNGCFSFALSGRPSFSQPTRAFFAALPTDVGTLNTYLRDHVEGSSSRDEAVFVAVGDALRTADGLASPKLRGALLGVLSRTPGVLLHENQTDHLGRRAIRADFVDQRIRPGQVQSLYFDPTTFRLLEERDGSNGAPTTYNGPSPAYDAAPGPGQDPDALTGAAFLTVMTGEQVVDSLPTIPKDCRR